MKEEISVFWFRRDLRLEDNTALYYALRDSSCVLPIFIFDSEILNKLESRSDARVTFIYNAIEELHRKLISVGSGLRVFHSTPLEVFQKLQEEFKIKDVYANRDYESYAIKRDKEITSFLSSIGASLYTFKDQVIYEKTEIVSDSGNPYKVFTPYKKKWISKLDEHGVPQFPSETLLDNLLKGVTSDFPSLESLGFSRSNLHLPSPKFNQPLISEYTENRDYPGFDATSRLGIHFRFGTISIRTAVKNALTWNDTWLNELIWREFYMQILSNFPHVEFEAFKPQYRSIPWLKNESDFENWKNGTTGFPLVDAGMRQLNQTGFMHNRVRMVTASFLTKHLLLNWQWGEAYFAAKLLDFELASNNGGWQWAAGTGTDAQPYFRVFNPENQMKKFDPDLHYIKKWIPEYGTKDYPIPIIDHKFARQRAIKTYKMALKD